VLAELEDEDRILFRYTDINGSLSPECNPNGSQNSIAGVMNKERNVLGMMPHPERVADPRLGKADGRALFLSLLHSFS
jgi:phosphoribosylformylglycinamidine synthase